MQKYLVWLLGSFLGVGLVIEVLGFSQHLGPLIWLVLLLPFITFLLIGQHTLFKCQKLPRSEKLLFFLLIAIWLVHLTGVFVPETGFDAVWYHLPVVAAFVQHGGYFYWPKYYQSLNPFFADGIFLAGYEALGALGAKIVSYLFGLGLILVSYQVAHQFLPRFWTLLLILTISTFQVVTWQSSSFYIDVVKAFWEMAAVYFLLKDQRLSSRNLLLAGLFFGASLGTKLFSILLWPVFILMMIVLFFPGRVKLRATFWQKQFIKAALFSFAALIVALPFHLFAYLKTGNAFYSIGIHVDKLGEIGGNASLLGYLLQRTLLLPSSLTQLTLYSRDYTTLLLLIFAILPIIFWRQLYQNKKLLSLLIFASGQWLVWWYVPPLSSRYALSGFVILAVILFWCLQKYVTEKPAARKYVLATIIFALVINLLPRMVPLKRDLTYLSGRQTKEQYVKQFYDGSIDNNLKAWYHLSTN